MTPFYFSEIKGSHAYLYGDEAKHCLKVMRKRTGEAVLGIDGKGTMYQAYIVSKGKSSVELEIIGRESEWGEKKQRIQLLVSPLHKPDRFEWLVEKSVELGVNEILPFLGKHTVKTGLRVDRLERIALAALKQSLRSRLPVIHSPAPLEEVLSMKLAKKRLVAHGPSGRPFAEQLSGLAELDEICLLVGPEGDFDSAELEMATDKGFEAVGLGNNRLRSETAAIHLLGLVKLGMGY